MPRRFQITQPPLRTNPAATSDVGQESGKQLRSALATTASTLQLLHEIATAESGTARAAIAITRKILKESERACVESEARARVANAQVQQLTVVSQLANAVVFFSGEADMRATRIATAMSTLAHQASAGATLVDSLYSEAASVLAIMHSADRGDPMFRAASAFSTVAAAASRGCDEMKLLALQASIDAADLPAKQLLTTAQTTQAAANQRTIAAGQVRNEALELVQKAGAATISARESLAVYSRSLALSEAAAQAPQATLESLRTSLTQNTATARAKALRGSATDVALYKWRQLNAQAAAARSAFASAESIRAALDHRAVLARDRLSCIQSADIAHQANQTDVASLAETATSAAEFAGTIHHAIIGLKRRTRQLLNRALRMTTAMLAVTEAARNLVEVVAKRRAKNELISPHVVQRTAKIAEATSTAFAALITATQRIAEMDTVIAESQTTLAHLAAEADALVGALEANRAELSRPTTWARLETLLGGKPTPLGLEKAQARLSCATVARQRTRVTKISRKLTSATQRAMKAALAMQASEALLATASKALG